MAPLSRIRRLEEKKLKKRMTWALVGTVAIILFFAFFGLKLLTFFSLGVDVLRGSGTTPSPEPGNVLLPPVLDPLPEATNSGVFSITGRGQPKTTLIVFINGTEEKKLTIEEDGTFRTPRIELKNGENSISAKIVDESGAMSDLSHILEVNVITEAPELEINEPEDGADVHGEPGTVKVSGKTEEGATLTINDRFVVVESDGTFTYNYRLTEGENTLKIVTKDTAGNSAEEERKVTWYK